MPPYTLKWMAESGYVMGLSTIGEVACHMELHYDAYFLISELSQQMREFEEMFAGHMDDSIDLYLTDEDKKRMDDELERVMEQGSTDDKLEEFL
jgi:hypothetical protein